MCLPACRGDSVVKKLSKKQEALCKSINDHDYHVWNKKCKLNASSNISFRLKLTWTRYDQFF